MKRFSFLFVNFVFLVGMQSGASADLFRVDLNQGNRIYEGIGWQNQNWSGTPDAAIGWLGSENYPMASVLFNTSLNPLDLGYRNSSTLHVTVTGTQVVGSSLPITVRIHPLVTEYGHGECTWNDAKTSLPWATAGGDYDPNTYATLILREDDGIDDGHLGEHTCDIEPLMEYWETNVNYGMILIAQDASGGGRNIALEGADPNERPYIELDQGTRLLKSTLYPGQAARITDADGYQDYSGVWYERPGIVAGIIGWVGSSPPGGGYALNHEIFSVAVDAADFSVGNMALLHLEVTVNEVSGTGQAINIKIHPLAAPYTSSETSWLNASSGVPWTTAGGDYDAGVYSDLQLRDSSSNPLGSYTADVTALLEFWETNPNYGMIMVCQNWDGGARSIGYGNHPTAAPYIEVYEAAPPADCAEVWVQGLGIASDLNKDCKVDLADFAQIAEDWLRCNIPGQEGCEQIW